MTFFCCGSNSSGHLSQSDFIETYKGTFDHSDQMHVVYNLKGRICYANAIALRILKVTAREILEKNVGNYFIHAEKGSTIKEDRLVYIKSQRNNKTFYNLSTRIENISRKTQLISVIAAPKKEETKKNTMSSATTTVQQILQNMEAARAERPHQLNRKYSRARTRQVAPFSESSITVNESLFTPIYAFSHNIFTYDVECKRKKIEFEYKASLDPDKKYYGDIDLIKSILDAFANEAIAQTDNQKVHFSIAIDELPEEHPLEKSHHCLSVTFLTTSFTFGIRARHPSITGTVTPVQKAKELIDLLKGDISIESFEEHENNIRSIIKITLPIRVKVPALPYSTTRNQQQSLSDKRRNSFTTPKAVVE